MRTRGVGVATFNVRSHVLYCILYYQEWQKSSLLTRTVRSMLPAWRVCHTCHQLINSLLSSSSDDRHMIQYRWIITFRFFPYSRTRQPSKIASHPPRLGEIGGQNTFVSTFRSFCFFLVIWPKNEGMGTVPVVQYEIHSSTVYTVKRKGRKTRPTLKKRFVFFSLFSRLILTTWQPSAKHGKNPAGRGRGDERDVYRLDYGTRTG